MQSLENIIGKPSQSDHQLLYNLTLKLQDDPATLKHIEIALAQLNYPIEHPNAQNIYMFKTLALDYNNQRPFTDYHAIVEKWRKFVFDNPWTIEKYDQLPSNKDTGKKSLVAIVVENVGKSGVDIAKIAEKETGEQYEKVYPKVLRILKETKKAAKPKPEPQLRPRRKRR